MKKCPYCAEEILDEAIKCRYCREMLTKKGGTAGSNITLILSSLFLIASIGYVLYTFATKHEAHGHHYLQDPEHIAGIVAATIGAYITWRELTQPK